MASRFPVTKVQDYCFHPIHIVDDNKDLFVPCGKCQGCLLHKANEWSMRLGMEVENTPFSIFSTLTYNNFYLPKMKIVGKDRKNSSVYLLSVDNDRNIRFNGAQDVLRNEDFEIISCHKKDFIQIQNFDSNLYTCYSSKRDYQLYLKLLRKDLENNGIIRKSESGAFRYFAISEYGPTTFRSHIHQIILPKNEKIASYLIECGLYKNWQMCDKDRFDEYTHYCDSGVRGYLTNYVTGFSALPSVYTSNKEIKPFRLSSKSPAIGYVKQTNEEIYENVSIGVIEYSRQIPRLGTKVIIDYPKNYTNTLFVKCEGYGKLSFSRLLFIYSQIFRLVRFGKFSTADAFKFVFETNKSMNYAASRKCFLFCLKYGTTPEYYLYLLDMYYYKRAMRALKLQYEFQEKVMLSLSLSKIPCEIVSFLRSFYVNVSSFLSQNITSYGENDYINRLFIDGFYLSDLSDFEVVELLNSASYRQDSTYIREVEDICSNMVKMAKWNEMTGNSPHIF